MTKSATRVAADEVSAPIASPVFTGNVGVGVTPEAWYSNYVVNQIGTGGALSARSSAGTGPSQVYLSANMYVAAGGTDKRIAAEAATIIRQASGAISFDVAPSGTADAAISWTTAMTINNAGIVTKPLQPIISVSRNNSSLSFTTNQDVFASTSMLNWVVQGISHNTSNGRFTVPVAGKYYVHFFSMKNNDVSAYFNVLKNGSSMGLRIYDTANATSWHSYGLGGVFTLAANDYLNVVCGDGASSNAHGLNHMNFTIHLIG